MRRHILIINPAAGKGMFKKYISQMTTILKNLNEEYSVVFTKYPGHATSLVKGYCQDPNNRIYSIGGDGTLNEVINGAVFSSNVIVNIPSGSGNDFIRSMTDIKDPLEIFKKSLITDGKYIDVIKINNRYCVNIASVGIDATVAFNVKAFKKIPFISGGLAYLLSIFRTLIRYSAYDLEMKFDEKDSFLKKSLLVAIANGKYYGGGIKAAPDARIDDGLIDVCMAEDMKRMHILKLLSKYKKGEHVGLKEIRFEKCKKLLIRSGKKLQINIDGEIIEDDKLDIEIIEKAVNIAVIDE